MAASQFLDAFYSEYGQRLQLNSESARFIVKLLADSENFSEAKVSKSSFLRIFRKGIEKGFAELMMSTDMSLEGEGMIYVSLYFPQKHSANHLKIELQSLVHTKVLFLASAMMWKYDSNTQCGQDCGIFFLKRTNLIQNSGNFFM